MTVFLCGARVSALLSILVAGSVPALAQVIHNQEVTPAPVETPYLQENDTAMTTMMNAMAAKPTGDVNRDFVETMIPHHQGAIEMAQAYLRYGSNEQLKRIAQEIIVEQQQAIAAMRLSLGDPLPASTAAPTQVDADADASSGASSSNASSHAPAMQMMMKPVK